MEAHSAEAGHTSIDEAAVKSCFKVALPVYFGKDSGNNKSGTATMVQMVSGSIFFMESRRLQRPVLSHRFELASTR